MVALVACATRTLQAQESYNEILSSFNEVSANGANASPRAQAIALKHNETLQHLRIQGKIPERTFQNNQANFQRIIDQNLGEVAKNNKMQYKAQAKAPTKTTKLPTPGADTDAIFSSADKTKPMTANQVAKARTDFNGKINDFLKNNGVSPATTGGKPPNLNVSILPDPGSMSKSEWQKAIDAADAAGEVVYKNPAAAAAEAKIRAGQPLSMSEANARVEEVQRLAKDHLNAADDLAAQARKLPPGPQRQALEAQSQILRHNAAKYVNRINETGEYIAKQSGVTPVGEKPGGTMKQAEVRGVEQAGKAGTSATLNQHFIGQATESYVQNLAEVAKNSKNPGAVMQARDNIAKALNGLPPAQQGNMIDALRRTNGDKFAGEVAKTMRGLPKPKVGPAPPGKLAKTMKVLGPAMIIYEGGKRIQAVAEADDASHEAGKQLGGFVGGTAGATAGGLAGAKAGGLIGTAIAGPIGGTVGAIVGGVYGGIKGYGYGSAHGTEMGDTDSKYWAKNKSQEEFNKVARDNNLDTPDSVYNKLRSMGVSEVDALQAAADYERGSLKAFRDQLRALREKMVKENKWSPKGFRRFGNLEKNEVSELLDCLCSASLGANPWVAQGYNLTIPPDADPKKHSCGSLANGPCMAQGFGCWRSFIDLTSDRARECFEAFNIDPQDMNAIRELDKFNQDVEEPLTVDVTVEPREVCPGDTIKVSVTARGGRGRYVYRYHGGMFLTEGIPDGDTRTSSFVMTVDPTLTRRAPVYTRPAEAYNTFLQVVVSTDIAPYRQDGIGWSSSVADPYGRKSKVVQAKSQMINITLRSHAECEKLHPAEGTGPPSRTPVKKPATPPPPITKSGTTRGTSPSAPAIVPAAPTSSTAPPYQAPPTKTSTRTETHSKATAPETKGTTSKEKITKTGDKRTGSKEPAWEEPVLPPPDTPTECWVGAMGSGTPEEGNTFGGQVREGRRVRITLTGPHGTSTSEGVTQTTISLAYVPGDYAIKVEDLDQPECVDERTVTVPEAEPDAVETKAPVGNQNCDECMEIGGGMQGSASGFTDAQGNTTSSSQASAMYYAQGCEGQHVRISVKGSDGWTGSGEAHNQRAEVVRPIGLESGTDEITVENLSIPGCSRTFSMPFGPLPDLRGVEAPPEDVTVAPPSTTGRLENWTGTKTEKSDKNYETGMGFIGAQTDIQQASNIGNQQIKDARITRDAGGQDAGAITATEQSRIRIEAAKDATPIMDAVLSGVESGLSQAGAQLGGALGSHVAGEIFDDRKPKAQSSPSPSSDTPAGGRIASSGGSAPKPPAGPAPSPVVPPPAPADAASPAPEIMADALCPVCGQMYNPATPHSCPGTPELVAPEPVVEMCAMCNAQPGTKVTTMEGSSIVLCGSCQAQNSCSVCGKLSQELQGAGYGYVDASGNEQSFTIRNACPGCVAKWKREHGLE